MFISHAGIDQRFRRPQSAPSSGSGGLNWSISSETRNTYSSASSFEKFDSRASSARSNFSIASSTSSKATTVEAGNENQPETSFFGKTKLWVVPFCCTALARGWFKKAIISVLCYFYVRDFVQSWKASRVLKPHKFVPCYEVLGILMVSNILRAVVKASHPADHWVVHFFYSLTICSLFWTLQMILASFGDLERFKKAVKDLDESFVVDFFAYPDDIVVRVLVFGRTKSFRIHTSLPRYVVCTWFIIRFTFSSLALAARMGVLLPVVKFLFLVVRYQIKVAFSRFRRRLVRIWRGEEAQEGPDSEWDAGSDQSYADEDMGSSGEEFPDKIE